MSGYLIDEPAQLIAALVGDRPLLDLRSPAEFARGAFPAARNMPLLDDPQRAEIGKIYRHRGREAAIAHGNALFDDARKGQRVAAWAQLARRHPETAIYCWRGGLRSQIAQRWLADEGLMLPRLDGGYKRMRSALIEGMATASRALPLGLVAGRTGSGKTRLINALPAAIDLEGLANHRGSAFGKRLSPQPPQAGFENALAIQLLRAQARQPPLFLEDESRAIGSLAIPMPLFTAMGQAPIALIEEPLEDRAATIMQDYILANFAELQDADPSGAPERFRAGLLDSLGNIRRRFGGERQARVEALLREALDAHLRDGDPAAHGAWIRELLENYYDPMYDYQLGRKMERVVFRGSGREFLHWAGSDASAAIVSGSRLRASDRQPPDKPR